MTHTETLSGAVVSEHHIASRIGTDILRQGGNAVDAIISTIIAVNTLAPYHSDLGGGGFAVIRDASGHYQTLGFRHTAPKEAKMEFYQAGASTSIGGASVAVPGQMRGLEELHRKYGKLPWRDLFRACIKLAREGVPMGRDLHAFSMRGCLPTGSDRLSGSWYESDAMYHPLFRDGRLLPVGELFKREDFARTLELISEYGADAFYQGEVAEGIVNAVQARGGVMTLSDLEDYRPIWREAITGHFRGHRLKTVSAPASGSIWILALQILDHFQPSEQGSALDYHRLTEALRFAYSQRTELGDPDYVPGLEKRQAEWLHPDYAKTISERISDEHTLRPQDYQPGRVDISVDNGTSNMTATDESGLVVSITTTVGLIYGSHIMVPGYGFVLNDSIDDFSVKGRPNGTGYEPSPANYVGGGRRPLSSSCPYIVEDGSGRVVLAGGSAGGSTIISANVQVVCNVLDHGMSAEEALRAARLHNQVLPNVTQLERRSLKNDVTVDGFSQQTAEEYATKGHQIEWVAANRSTPCAIGFHSDGTWSVAADPRKYEQGGDTYYKKAS